MALSNPNRLPHSEPIPIDARAVDHLRYIRETMASAALRFVLDTPSVDGLVIAPRRIEHFASLGLEPR